MWTPTLIYYPSPILKQKTSDLDKDVDVHAIVDVMNSIMKLNKGIGLAASQIGLLKSIIVIKYNNCPAVIINPKILTISEEIESIKEFCLSVPNYSACVKRPVSLTIQYEDINRETKIESFDGFEARCIQHELDHLNGIAYPDKLGQVNKTRAIAAVSKYLRK